MYKRRRHPEPKLAVLVVLAACTGGGTGGGVGGGGLVLSVCEFLFYLVLVAYGFLAAFRADKLSFFQAQDAKAAKSEDITHEVELEERAAHEGC